MSQYLLDYDNWEQLIDEHEGYLYYKPFPEFTIQRNSKPENEIQAYESWVRIPLEPVSYVYFTKFKYHQTVLHVEQTATYDGVNHVPVPDKQKITEYEKQDYFIYYYLNDNSIKTNYIKLLNNKFMIALGVGRTWFPLNIFTNRAELDIFICHLYSTYTPASWGKIPVLTDFKSSTKEWDIENNRFLWCVYEELIKWRNVSS